MQEGEKQKTKCQWMGGAGKKLVNLEFIIK